MKVLIVEDEHLAAAKLKKMMEKYDSGIEVLDNLTAVHETVQWLRENPAPDLIMMDIQIDDGVCFEIFQQVEVTSPVIFTTAYDQYAIKAFQVHSIDYLLKPFSYEKLKQSLEKLKKINASSRPTSASIDVDELLTALKQQEPSYKSRFLVKSGTKIRSIKTRDIAYVYTDRKLNLLVTNEGDRYPVDQSLGFGYRRNEAQLLRHDANRLVQCRRLYGRVLCQ